MISRIKNNMLLIIILMITTTSFTQVDSTPKEIKIELWLSIVNENGNSLPNYEIQLIKINDTTYNLISDTSGFVYTSLEVGFDYKMSKYEEDMFCNFSDYFTTKGIKKSTRIIREYVVMTKESTIESQKIEILYAENSIFPVNVEDSLDVIEFFSDFLTEHPHFVIEIRCFRQITEKKSISKKRAQYIFTKLVENGIAPDRLVIRDGGIKQMDVINDKYVADGMISIISMEYVPKE